MFSTAVPSSVFLSSGNLSTPRGNSVPMTMWNAGPLDLRWDPLRKVWTGPQSVYAGVVAAARRNRAVTDGTTPYLPSEITYDVQIYDGIANPVLITGVTPLNARPSDYYVYPVASGNACIVMHYRKSNGQPDYGVFLHEREATATCTTTSDAGTAASIASVFGADTLLYSTLGGAPLAVDYGGVGISSISSGQILIGKTGNIFGQYNLTNGTGIAIYTVGSNVYFGFASGVQFITSGVNTTITQLQGLTTPLSIGQGGTGASGQNFVDLTTNQVIGGQKTFVSGISVGPGLGNTNRIGFSGLLDTGFTATTGYRVQVKTSGVTVLDMGVTGCTLSSRFVITPTLSGGTVQTVNEGSNASLYYRPLTDWVDQFNTILGRMDNQGVMRAVQIVGSGTANSGYTSIFSAYVTSGQNVSPFSVTHGLLGSVFSMSPSGDVVMGSSGFRTTIANSSGSKTVFLPTNTGIIALKSDQRFKKTIYWSGTSFNVAVDDEFILLNGKSTGPYNANLPLTTSLDGRFYSFKNLGSVAGDNFIIRTSGTDRINLTVTGYVIATGTSVTLVCVNTGWFTYAGTTEFVSGSKG